MALFTTDPAHQPRPHTHAMLTSTIRPNRVRFATGATAERIQTRRDAAAVALHQERQQLQRDLDRIATLTATDRALGEVAAILGLIA